MACNICGHEGARVRRIARTYGKDLLVIENVSIVSCPRCGESYLTAKTLHELERLKLHRKSLAVERPSDADTLKNKRSPSRNTFAREGKAYSSNVEASP